MIARCRATRNSGFTLLEALVAIALLAMVVMHFLSTRTEALIDAADARSWRIAREVAERQLSIIKAGAHELPPENRTMIDLEDEFPGFSYQVLIGEAAISEVEADLAEGFGDDEESDRQSDRLEWQRDRDQLRRSRAAGVSFQDYEEQQRAEELEERIPSEDEFEDVAVVVYFPDLRERDSNDVQFATFMLRAKISTMAIEGLTPEQAQVVAESRGASGDPGAGGSSMPGGTGGR